MPDERKCEHGACKCNARADDRYCSDYCEQAATHGIQKDFCECGHPECEKRRPVQAY